jgi:hypothetical protein
LYKIKEKLNLINSETDELKRKALIKDVDLYITELNTI